MKSKASAMIAVAALALGGQSAQAQSSVAITAVDVPAQTDTRVSVPVTRQAVGSFEIATGGISSNTIVLDGASFANDQFPLNSQGNPLFYARFTSGALEGRWFNIAGHDATSVDLNTENTGDPADLSAAQDGDTLTIYPHWTMQSLLPDGLLGLSFTSSPSPFSPEFRVLLPRDSDGVGTNVPALTSLFYLGEPQNGWFSQGGTPSDDLVIAPQGTLILRNTNAVPAAVSGDASSPAAESGISLADAAGSELTFLAAGGRPAVELVEQIAVEDVQNDTVVGVNNIETVTLAESGLASAIDNSPSPFSRTDLLFLAPTAQAGAGFDPPATESFFRLNGDFFTFGGDPANDAEIAPGQVVIIRKDAGTAGSTDDLVTGN